MNEINELILLELSVADGKTTEGIFFYFFADLGSKLES